MRLVLKKLRAIKDCKLFKKGISNEMQQAKCVAEEYP